MFQKIEDIKSSLVIRKNKIIFQKCIDSIDRDLRSLENFEKAFNMISLLGSKEEKSRCISLMYEKLLCMYRECYQMNFDKNTNRERAISLIEHYVKNNLENFVV